MLSGLSAQDDPRVLVDMRTADDAGVMIVGKRRALVHTIDVITPIVDDPRSFGRIAAANAVSDIYAMGGKPTSAVSLLGIPKELPKEVVAPILEGAAEVLREAKAPLLGGHTIKDKELKLGFAVTGFVDPKKMITNALGEAGQVLLLTKALGTGVLFQAMKNGLRTEEETAAMIESMAALNRRAGKAMVKAGVRCATDVTGFGLAGHALNIARGSMLDVVFDAAALPMLPGVGRYLAEGIFPGTTNANLAGYAGGLVRGEGATEADERLAADPQTSGGMLIAVDPRDAKKLQKKLGAWRIGRLRAVAREKPGVYLERKP